MVGQSQTLYVQTADSVSQPWAHHGGRLRKANARIKRYASDLLNPHMVGRTQTQHDESASDNDSVSFDTEDFETWDTAVEKTRVQRLLNKLQSAKRDELLQSVHDKLRGVALSSRRELLKLEDEEQNQDRAMREFDVAVLDWRSKLNDQEAHTKHSVSNFKRTMQHIKQIRSRLSVGGSPAFFDRTMMLTPKDLDAMSDEDLTAEVQIMRLILQQKELEARECIRMVYEADPTAVCPQDDVIIEQERLLEKTSGTLQQIDSRSHALREATEYLTDSRAGGDDWGQSVDIDEIPALSDGVAKLLEEISADIPGRLLPQLQRERESKHSEELQSINKARLRKLHQQADELASSIQAVEKAIEQLTQSASWQEDAQSRISAASEGKEPQTLLVDSILEGIRPISSVVDCDSDGEVAQDSVVTLRTIREVSEDLQQDVRCGMVDQQDLISMVAETVYKQSEQARLQFECRQREEQAVQDALDTMTGHQQLYTDAVAVARGTLLPGTQPRFPSSCAAAHGTVGLDAVASIFAEAGSATPEEGMWMDAFLANMGNTFDKDSFGIQSHIINALAAEDMQLSQDVHEVTDSFNARVEDLSLALGGSADAHLLGQMEACVRDGQRSIDNFTSSREALGRSDKEVVEAAACKYHSVDKLLRARCLAVKTAGSLQSNALGAMAGGMLMDVVALEDENYSLSKQVSALGDEIEALRRHRASAMESVAKKRRSIKEQAALEPTHEQRDGSLKIAEVEEEPCSHMAERDALESIPGSKEARKLRRDCRELAAVRAEAKALAAAKLLFSSQTAITEDAQGLSL